MNLDIAIAKKHDISIYLSHSFATTQLSNLLYVLGAFSIKIEIYLDLTVCHLVESSFKIKVKLYAVKIPQLSNHQSKHSANHVILRKSGFPLIKREASARFARWSILHYLYRDSNVG